VSKYTDIAKGAKNAEALWKKCEQIEKKLGDNPSNILYSDKSESVVSYRERVMEMEVDKSDFLYSMAGHKGETFKSLGDMPVSDLFDFAERFNEEMSRNTG